MAEDIKQTLGFDVSQSLDALNQLDSAFTKMQANLQGSINTFTQFNAQAATTIGFLNQITGAANAAANAFRDLNNIKVNNPLPQTPQAAPTTGLTGQAAAQAMAQLLGQTTQAANAAAPALNNAANAAGNLGNSAAGAAGKTSGFAISLETLSRVVGTQVIVRALGSLRQAIEGSFQSFITFNQKVAEIQTIARGESIEGLAKGVRALSDEFNAPILDVAAAKYQVLSNGFTNTADSTKVLVAALKFAKVGISDVTSAADLISSALNAYGKSANEAEIISAKLFKTIELGRVVGQELATSFGRVAPIAKEIGASESEILAAFSSITIGGVKASEAATQIRATLTGLLKPSKDTEEAFRKLGVETGEELIRAKGFQGALTALIGTTDGSTASIAKLFPNVRALNGVLRETGGASQIYIDHLKEIQAASSEILNKTFKIRVESDAEKVSADLNKIKNFFTADLGKELVGITASMTSMIGGVNTVITGMKALAPVVGALVTALVAYNVASLAVTATQQALALANNQAAVSFANVAGGVATLAVLVVAARSLGQFIGESITRSIEAPFKAVQEEGRQRLQFETDQSSARIAIAEEESRLKTGIILDGINTARAKVFEITDAVKEANKEELADDKTTMDHIVAAREKFVNDLKRLSIAADNDIVDSRKRTSDLQNQLDDRRFEQFNKNITNQTAVFAREQQRAQQLAKQAAEELSKASKPEEQAKATQDFSRAEQFAKEAAETAKTTGNRAQQITAERTIQDILQRRIQAEKDFQANRAADAERLAQEAAKEQARVDYLKRDAKEFLEKSNFFDKKGELLPTDQVKKNLADAKAALDRFKENAFGKSATQFNLGDLISFDRLEQRLNQSVQNVRVQKLEASPQSLEGMFNQIQKAADARKIILQSAVDPKALGGLNNSDAARVAAEQAKQLDEQVNKLRQGNEARRQAEADITQQIKESNASYQQQQGFIEQIAEGGTVLARSLAGAGRSAVEAKQQLNGLREQMQDLIKNPNATAEQVNALASKLASVVKNIPRSSQTDVNRAQQEYDALKNVVTQREKIKELDKAGVNPQALLEAEKLQTAISSQAQARQKAAEAANQEKNATQQTVGPANSLKTAFDSSATATAQIASNMARAAASAEQAAIASSQIGSGGAETAAQGGFIQRFATGGFAQSGTDNIPAVLSPRESIINARQSERFHPQIVAMNAGITPSFNNTTNRAGDVNINGDIIVNEAKSGKTTVNQLIDKIRRAQRRGSGSNFS